MTKNIDMYRYLSTIFPSLEVFFIHLQKCQIYTTQEFGLSGVCQLVRQNFKKQTADFIEHLKILNLKFW